MEPYFVTIVKLESFIENNLMAIKSDLNFKQNFLNLLNENRTELVRKLEIICKNTNIPTLMLLDSANGYSLDDFIPYFTRKNQPPSLINNLNGSKQDLLNLNNQNIVLPSQNNQNIVLHSQNNVSTNQNNLLHNIIKQPNEINMNNIQASNENLDIKKSKKKKIRRLRKNLLALPGKKAERNV